jgi:hypothetical protein
VFTFAFSQPYTLTRLQNFLNILEGEIPNFALLIRTTIGFSLSGLDIPLLVLKQRSTGVVRSAFQKPVIVISAR